MDILNQLREREHTLMTIFENSPSVVSLKDINGVYRFVNPNFKRILDYDSELIIGKSDHEIFPQEYSRIIQENDRLVLNEKKKMSFEEVIPKPDGTPLYFSSHKFPIYNDAKDEITFICSLSIDHTDKKLSEIRLKESETKLSAMFQNFPFPVSLMQLPEVIFADVNPAFTELLGFNREEVLGKTSVDLKIIDIEKRNKLLSDFNREEHVRNYETKLRAKDGREIYISNTLDKLEFNGKPYILVTLQDITEKKLIEEKLKLALESSNMGLWHYDPKTNQVTASPELRKILGIPNDIYDFAEINKKLVHPDDYITGQLKWKNAIKDRRTYTNEYRIIRPSGEIRWLLSTGQAKYSPDGEPIAMSGITMDITDKKYSELALQSALKSRDEFLSIASHELKTPLTSLLMHAQLQSYLSKKNAPEAYAKERVDSSNEKIEKLVFRLNRLVDDMLDISRIRTGKLTIKLKEINLVHIIKEVITRLKEIYSAEAGEIYYEGPDNLMLMADALRVDQVISNLIQNAIKYGEGKNIEVKLGHSSDAAILSIKDQGIGISLADQNKIFGLFERAISAYEISGMGLGLFISMEIIKAHHGKIKVDSMPGKGSTFFVELPLNK